MGNKIILQKLSDEILDFYIKWFIEDGEENGFITDDIFYDKWILRLIDEKLKRNEKEY